MIRSKFRSVVITVIAVFIFTALMFQSVCVAGSLGLDFRLSVSNILDTDNSNQDEYNVVSPTTFNISLIYTERLFSFFDLIIVGGSRLEEYQAPGGTEIINPNQFRNYLGIGLSARPTRWLQISPRVYFSQYVYMPYLSSESITLSNVQWPSYGGEVNLHLMRLFGAQVKFDGYAYLVMPNAGSAFYNHNDVEYRLAVNFVWETSNFNLLLAGFYGSQNLSTDFLHQNLTEIGAGFGIAIPLDLGLGTGGAGFGGGGRGSSSGRSSGNSTKGNWSGSSNLYKGR